MHKLGKGNGQKLLNALRFPFPLSSYLQFSLDQAAGKQWQFQHRRLKIGYTKLSLGGVEWEGKWLAEPDQRELRSCQNFLALR
ncbi:hypothetical protein LINPERHAP2_LOCUS36015 [Linum perenne]